MGMPKSPGEWTIRSQIASIALLGATILLIGFEDARSEPIECTTQQEQIEGIPTNITECQPVVTVDKFFLDQYYSNAAPFAEGVSTPYALADMLGITLNNQGDGTIKAFGFPDQQITLDGTEVENTYKQLMGGQVRIVPIRTKPIDNGFCGKLPLELCFN